MKTPDEIKKLLASHKNYIYSAEELFADALSYIRELEAKVAELDKRCDASALNATTAIRELEETKLRCLEHIKVFADKLAEYEKPRIPLTLAEAKAKNMKSLPLYMECRFTECWHGVQPLNGWVVGLGWMRSWGSPDDEPVGFLEKGYGAYWRCWSQEPNDEERKAAEWDD